MDAVLSDVARRIATRGLSPREAAAQIGVTQGSLARHLRGAYARSDSLARYRAWLARSDAHNTAAGMRPIAMAPAEAKRALEDESDAPPPPWASTAVSPRRRVVDLFAGCGGMSLGFDLLGEGAVFDTTLALDIDDAMVRAWNANRPEHARPACRRVDLVAFDHEAEVLGFYLDHLAAREGDADLARALASLPRGPLADFRGALAALDEAFVRELVALREAPAHARAWRAVAAEAHGQTSVTGFFDALGLPTGAQLGPLPWARADEPRDADALSRLQNQAQVRARVKTARSVHGRAWRDELAKLEARAAVRGARGQLASSAGRIGAFARFVRDPAVVPVYRAWLAWRATRDALRAWRFDDAATHAALERAYAEPARRVDVVLGGPPCQGFSRIGRGKLRSLGEHGVRVHEDGAAGDRRNTLLHKYVLFVAALAPRVFLFENVRHFQARVATREGARGFLATEVLADAIRAVSNERLEYAVAMRTVDCSRHLLPQARERFVMAGVRSRRADPASLLALRERAAVPLASALADLPAALSFAGRAGADLARAVHVADEPAPTRAAHAHYRAWIRQRIPRSFALSRSASLVDGHTARASRADDAAFFARMAPGTRWMDYRCDEAATLGELRALLDVVARERARPKSPLAAIDGDALASLRQRLDGSLALRLLLESIEPLPGELVHHLAAPAYLAKREGNHGDWLARLDARKPCKTIVSHMGKDTYAYVHPTEARTLSVREAARIQGFPDWFSFGVLSLVDAFRVIGNAVPPLVSHQFAARVAAHLSLEDVARVADAR